MKDHITDALVASLAYLNDSDYKTTWSQSVSNVSFKDRESDDRCELEWNESSKMWIWESSQDDPISDRDLVNFMQWAKDVHVGITAQDRNHHGNVLFIEIENGKVVSAG